MVEVVKCPKCNGLGCDFCQGRGIVYIEVKGKENTDSNSLFPKLVIKLFEEPHDYIWAIKKVKK